MPRGTGYGVVGMSSQSAKYGASISVSQHFWIEIFTNRAIINGDKTHTLHWDSKTGINLIENLVGNFKAGGDKGKIIYLTFVEDALAIEFSSV